MPYLEVMSSILPTKATISDGMATTFTRSEPNRKSLVRLQNPLSHPLH